MPKKRSIGHIKKLPDDKYLLRLSLGTDDFGKRIQPSKVVNCTSDREAEKLLLEFYQEREKLKIKHFSGIPKTLGQLYNEWFKNHVLQNLSPQTAQWYENLWKKHLEYAANIQLDVLSPSHIHKIIQDIQGERARNAVFKMVKSILNKGVKWGYLTHNVCSMTDTPSYEADEKPTLSKKQIEQLIPLIEKEELKYQALYYFAILCGLRRQECIGLKWDDINFSENSFTIRRAAIQIKGKGTSTGKTKTKKSHRTLFLPDILKKILLKLMNEQLDQKEKCGDKWVDNNWIFTQWNGEIMSLQTPSHWWRNFVKTNNIETKVTFHCLRHTSATHMIKNNVPISTVSGVLGHAKMSTTVNTYTHVIEDTKKDAINIMADIIESASMDSVTPIKTHIG